ncbi:hypothetical protein V6N12_019979 [Hibiscus sabdariffa]|uniref:Uncharacterized protein n=1 Tax=Hibiscus sabdariffa TaxID=183260 RepID=A0ABR2BH60_9ROSI
MENELQARGQDQTISNELRILRTKLRKEYTNEESSRLQKYRARWISDGDRITSQQRQEQESPKRENNASTPLLKSIYDLDCPTHSDRVTHDPDHLPHAEDLAVVLHRLEFSVSLRWPS